MINIFEVKEVSHIKEVADLAYTIWNQHYTPII